MDFKRFHFHLEHNVRFFPELATIPSLKLIPQRIVRSELVLLFYSLLAEVTYSDAKDQINVRSLVFELFPKKVVNFEMNDPVYEITV